MCKMFLRKFARSAEISAKVARGGYVLSELRCMSSPVRPSVCLSSVTFVGHTQGIEIFGNVSAPFGTLAICDLSVKILRTSS